MTGMVTPLPVGSQSQSFLLIQNTSFQLVLPPAMGWWGVTGSLDHPLVLSSETPSLSPRQPYEAHN